MTLIEHLRERIRETTAALDAAHAEVTAAKAREDGLAADLEGYKMALQAEMKRNVVAASPATAEAEVVRVQDEASAQINLAVLSKDDEPVNKTNLVHNMIREHVDGLTPPDVYRAIKNLGIEIHRNYVYSILDRLQKQGKIKLRRDKYVATDTDLENKLFKVG
jgi:hypothetical protein